MSTLPCSLSLFITPNGFFGTGGLALLLFAFNSLFSSKASGTKLGALFLYASLKGERAFSV
jgi:hypothetical protein